MAGLADALSLATLAVLSAVMPLALVAAYGFREAPFGTVLGPLPVTFGGFVVLNGVQVLELDVSPWTTLAVSSVAVVATFLSALNATLVLTERRAL